MKTKLIELSEKLVNFHDRYSELEELIKEIRIYYKYQNEHTDSISEDLIVGFSDLEPSYYINLVNELLDYED